MHNEKDQPVAREVSVGNIFDFFMRCRALILYWCLAGLLLASAYVVLAPKQYEAAWQVQMAQITKGNNTNTNVSTSNVEEPELLIERLRMQTTFSDAVMQACGITNKDEVGEYLNGALKVKVIKNIASVVSMTFRGTSPEGARVCAEAITEMIVQQHRELIEEHLAGRQEQLAAYQRAMQEEQRRLELIMKKDSVGNFAYLTLQDKLSWLSGHIGQLQEEMLLSQKHPAKLVEPIYVRNKQVAPKVGLTMLLGALAGAIMGALYGVARGSWRRAYKKI